MSAVAIEKSRKIAKFAWGVLAWNVAVVLWGAFVRASGSGAGCGRHWPLCNGEVVPSSPGVKTMVEAFHRATSGLALVAVVALLVMTMRGLPKGHRARKSAGWATFFVFGEAIIGAGLVLFELVAHDASMKRGLSMTLHLGNTFLLLGALALTAWWTTVETLAPVTLEPTKKPALLKASLGLALGGVLVLGASGAVAALGDTLFPALSLREGLAQDLSPLSHVFLKLRMLHPVIALGNSVLVLGAAALVRALSGNRRAHLLSRGVTLMFVTQFAAGMLNVYWLAPIAMQLVHLFLADVTWIFLVLMSWEAGRSQSVPFIMSRNGPGPSSDVPPSIRIVDPVM
jgi:heme A synthase